MTRRFLALALAALFTVHAGCGTDSEAEARLAEANARTAEAEARIAELEAGGMPTAAPTDTSPEPTAPAPAPAPTPTTPAPTAGSNTSGGSSQPTSRSNSYTVPARSGAYTGGFDLTGVKTLCHTYSKTNVSAFRGMELCYEVDLKQTPDGRISGGGIKISEETPSAGYRQLPPTEQTRMLVEGYIANGETVHLAYTVQGARRSTKGVATYASDNSPTPNYNMVGTFRTDAAGASGPARLDF